MVARGSASVAAPSVGWVLFGGTMRLAAAAFAALSALILTGGAQAEKQTNKQAERHIFVIANDADAYGVDRCLASNAACGTMVANAYCHSHEYAQALSFRKVEPDDIAGAITASRSDDRSCSGSRCGELVAIECSR
jgi:hypothetical protein